MESANKTRLRLSEIQHFSVGDGPGIRSTVFFLGCNLRCPWCHNPETLTAEDKLLRFENGKEKHCGVTMTADEVLDDVMTDIDFYSESKGGVTLSGGEVLLQAEGAAELAGLLCGKGVPVIVDTAGNVPYAAFGRLIPYTDAFYLDIKAGNAEDYAGLGGEGCFERICGNLRRLLDGGCAVRIRIPLIPRFNIMPEKREEICRLLAGFGIGQVDLLPFHRLGAPKYRALGLEYAYAGTPSMTKGEAEEIAADYRRYFEVRIEQ